ncbi:MAG TPA: hypothetical protein DCR95_02330 [Desulfobacter sp.]|nr:hypothetical protein [Desulfobacter sp.]
MPCRIDKSQNETKTPIFIYAYISICSMFWCLVWVMHAQTILLFQLKPLSPFLFLAELKYDHYSE